MENMVEPCKAFIIDTLRFLRLARSSQRGYPGIGVEKLHQVISATHCPLEEYALACHDLWSADVLTIVGDYSIMGTQRKSSSSLQGITDLPVSYKFDTSRIRFSDGRMIDSVLSQQIIENGGTYIRLRNLRLYIRADGVPKHIVRLLK